MTGVKKSNFTATPTIPGTATLDYVLSGQNFKITYDDFLGGLGVTGSIVTVGGDTDTPILDSQGSVKGIRSLEEGFGISLDITPENGIKISTATTFDTTGAQLVDDVTASPANFKSLVQGANMLITESTPGQILIAFDESDVVPLSLVAVNSLADLPAPSGGKIQLEGGKYYWQGVDITSPDELHMGQNTVWTSGSSFGKKWTYTGTGVALNSINVTSNIRDANFNAPSGQGFLYSSASGNDIVSQDAVIFDSAVKYGSVNNLFGFNSTDSSCFAADDGITVTGSTTVFSIKTMAIFGLLTGNKGIDFGTSTHSTLELRDPTMGGAAGAFGISGLASSGNINSGSVGTVTGADFDGVITPLENISPDDTRWIFGLNDEIPDTNPDALASLTANATNTVISTVNTPTKILGTWVDEGTSIFETDATGKITYKGERDISVPIDLSGDLQPVSGTNKDLRLMIALNGTEIASSARLIRADTGNPQNVVAIWQLTMCQDDFIEGFVENTTDDIDILVSGAVLRVR